MLRAYRSSYPRVDPSAFVDDSAQVIGDVQIGEASSIWMNAVVRGDIHWIRIGRRTNVQDGTVIHVMGGSHPTLLGDEVSVGHAAVVHGCTVEDCCLIGMGAIVLNGATVGRQSIVAAGALITEGQVIPSRSLVMGNPGRVKRSLTDDDVESIRRIAAHYVEYRRGYQAQEADGPASR